MLEMQKMMAMMSAQMARIASPALAVPPPQAPSAMVAPTPPLTTRTRLTFPGFGVPPVHRMNLTTPPTAPPPPPASYRQSDVARFKVVGIQRGSVDDIKFSMWNFNNAVATFGLKEIAAWSSSGSTAQVADLKILVVKWVEEDRNIVQFLINKFGGRICGQVDTPPHKKQLFFQRGFFLEVEKKTAASAAGDFFRK